MAGGIPFTRIVTTSLALFALMSTLLVGCRKQEKPESQSIAQRTFASPEEAGAALFDAAKSGDQAALLAIFGPDSKKVLFSGDPVQDKNARENFVDAYTQMHRWRDMKVGGEMLYIGADNFPFPIPLGKNSSGQWVFDTAAGKDEVLARRIGKDELTAIAACQAIVDAQKQYFRQAHDGEKVRQYAQKFISDDGKQNGLYWPVSQGQAPSPLENAHEFAEAMGYSSDSGGKHQPFVGYYFRILTKQGDKAKGGSKDYIVNGNMTGGFAVLAYPAEYRDSGIMTFLVGPDGVVYQRDLGEKTTETAETMTAYNPGENWKPAT
jgi:hypothetical protein